MSGQSVDRRTFIVAGSALVAGAVVAGIARMIGGNESPAGQSVAPHVADQVPTTPVDPATASRPPASSSTSSSTSPQTSTSTTTTAPPPVVVPVLCRQSWGARPVDGELVTHEVDQITVHHTAVPLESNTDAPARVRQHQSYHQEIGWPDLAYHYIIDAAGYVYEGRPVTAVGDTATDYDPTGHLLVCCEGNFDQQNVSAAQLKSLVGMLAWGAAEFGVAPSTIRGHRDVASTTCPGDRLYTAIVDGSLAADVTAVIAAGAPEMEYLCGDPAAELVAVIEAGTA